MSKVAKMGSVVSILYKGGVEGEEPVDIHTDPDKPLTVMLGDMKIPMGIEEALFNMEVGQEKNLIIPPEKGYGNYQEKLATWYPKQMLNLNYEMQVGDVLFHTNPEDGHKQPAFITELTQDNVKIDFNHPFAGKTLKYWIKLVDVQ